jgi:hypothetical protein
MRLAMLGTLDEVRLLFDHARNHLCVGRKLQSQEQKISGELMEVNGAVPSGRLAAHLFGSAEANRFPTRLVRNLLWPVLTAN